MNYPSATYRVQLNSEFTFKDLAEIIDYLHDLGISTIYAAPITSSKKDSPHGYDVIDPSVINPQIGTLEELRVLRDKLKQFDMNWLQDIVPNHMSLSTGNSRLMDVLERGSDSPYYTYFDIDWQHKDAKEKLWLPILGDSWQSCLEAGSFHIVFDMEKGFEFHYYAEHFPLAVAAVKELLMFMRETHVSPGLAFVIEDLIKGAEKKELRSWLKHKKKYTEEIVAQFTHDIAQSLLIINKDKNKVAQILERQPYQLIHWELSQSQMNYRRFFTINDLICLRIEDKSVFDDYHSFFYYLYKEELVQGFRLDHIDGLYDPLEYIKRLRKKLGSECYVIVEKILEYNEHLPKDWDIQGTSGYEFLSFFNRVLTDQLGAEKLKQFYHAFTQSNIGYDELVFKSKHDFLYSQMLGELDNLMDLLIRLKLTDHVTLERKRIRIALGLFMAAFPIYRIYPAGYPIDKYSMPFVDKAFDVACAHDNTYKAELIFIRSLFQEDQSSVAELKLQFVRRLMQFTGPLAAKGVEDTVFYVYNPLISHNEVGDAPSELSCTVMEFHDQMINRQINNPHALNSSSTHDTKRGEDARARLNVLSYLSHEWESIVMQWHSLNQKFTYTKNNRRFPSLNDEYFIYQSLLGAFSEDALVDASFIKRTQAFMLKALREAKVETTYTKNDKAYETACLEFIASILSAEHSFRNSFVPFLNKVISYAAIYSLVQTTIKLTAPGIPDIYQGSELWELSYVDPDNRRKVDYNLRKNKLKEIKDKKDNRVDWLKSKRTEEVEKLFVIHKLLHLRKNTPTLFTEGIYTPLKVSGKEGKAIAFLRSLGTEHVLVVLPIGFDLNAEGDFRTSWNDVAVEIPTSLSNMNWTNVMTEQRVVIKNNFNLRGIFSEFPIAVYKND